LETGSVRFTIEMRCDNGEGHAMNLPSCYVLPVFLLIAFCGAMVLGPILDLVLAPWGIPFHRVMSRALLISALGALVLFRGRLRLAQWWPRERAWPQIGFGLLLAFISAQTMIALYGACAGFVSAQLLAQNAARSLLTALVAALIVPLLEETIFRGFLVTVLAESLGRRAGWLLAAFIYAAAHFLRIPPTLTDHPLHFYSGVTAILATLGGLAHGNFLTGQGLNLFLVGLILGGIFLRSGTLWINAALHGGWILILMAFSAFTRPLVPPRVSWLGGDLLSSPLTSAILLALGIWLWKFYGVPVEPENETAPPEKKVPEGGIEPPTKGL
jgi:membrane protease YdiL (CAAX protease family)